MGPSTIPYSRSDKCYHLMLVRMYLNEEQIKIMFGRRKNIISIHYFYYILFACPCKQ